MNVKLLKFAVIAAKSNGKWVFCKYRERDTYEFPGGHKEPNESIIETARRELYEETGAIEFKLDPICVYSVTSPNNCNEKETFGLLCFAEITEFEGDLHNKIEKIIFSDNTVENWTYPFIQPKLSEELKRRNIV